MKERGPWKTRSEQLRYRNPWIDVEHHEVVNPAGGEGIYGVVRFHNLAVGVIPLDELGNTWLVGQYRYPHQRYSWEIVEGGGPVNVDPLQSAQRELAEEVGLRAARWDLILEMDLSNSVTDERCLIYLARELSHCTALPDDTEQLQVRKLPFDLLYEEVVAGRHRDSLTVAGVLKLRVLMERGQVF